jgi:hypothetical protein
MAALTDNDRYYLRSILRVLQEVKERVNQGESYGLGNELIADNIDWLDCFIESSTNE